MRQSAASVLNRLGDVEVDRELRLFGQHKSLAQGSPKMEIVTYVYIHTCIYYIHMSFVQLALVSIPTRLHMWHMCEFSEADIVAIARTLARWCSRPWDLRGSVRNCR